MHFARLNDVTLHYQTIGPVEGRPLLVFVNSLGTDFRIWRDVVVRLAGEVSILTYDLRGHGLSDVGDTPYSIEMLANDLAALLEYVGAPRAIVCGVSLGGVVAQQLAVTRPDLVRALVLCDTAAKIGEAAFWKARIAAIEQGGIAAIADTILMRWFTASFRSAGNAQYIGYRNMLVRQPVDGYLGCCAALRDSDLTRRARLISVPTICVVGDDDGSTPPEVVGAFAKTIPGAHFEIIKNCGHIPSIEQPAALTDIIQAFLALVGTEMISHVSH